MNEDLLHYFWKFLLFNKKDLRTTSGQSLEIRSVGFHNTHAGPDFEQAKIRIGDTLWAGNVEIHIHSSDWQQHKHQHNPAYHNVILHVVYEHDRAVHYPDGSEIPTLVLKNRISEQLLLQYKNLIHSNGFIPCEQLVKTVDSFHIQSWLSRILVERLEEKTALVHTLLKEYKNSWDDAFYVMVARNFGFKPNALPFELLARSLPQTLLAKHKNSTLQIEALIFGQAGFLQNDFIEDYPNALKKEYQYLVTKYRLKPIDKFLWKFLRMRPQNFPTLRLAQFAALVVKSNHLFSKILATPDINELKELFSKLPVHTYWKEHYHFVRPAAESVSVQLGKSSVESILLNTVSLFLFTYGKYFKKENYINRAFRLLESLPAETNQVVNRFNSIEFKTDHAYASQAVLQLKKNYCDLKKCLHCGIGIKLLQPNRV